MGDQSHNIAVRAFAFYLVDPGFIPSIQYGPLNPPGVILECKNQELALSIARCGPKSQHPPLPQIKRYMVIREKEKRMKEKVIITDL